MTSKIINMAEKIKDAEDRMLESLFASEPVADDGFSEMIVGRIRRRLWVRRLTLPVAAIIGGVVAFKPLTAFVAAASKLLGQLPLDALGATAQSVPQLQTIVLGGILLLVTLASLNLVQD